MINKLLRDLHSNQDKRSATILRQIFYSAGLKGVNAAVSFLIIPLYLSYLTEVSFGIWLTVSSVLNWFNFFDLGMGNGLRNRFAEALAENKPELAASYVSTTYGLISLVSTVLLLVFLVFHSFVDWGAFFSAPSQLSAEVDQMVFVLVIFFIPQFVLQLIKMIVTADQRPALVSLMNTSVNILHLTGIYLLIQFSESSLVNLSLVMASVNLAIPLVANILLFARKYKPYAPRISNINMAYSRDLMGLGFTFFILQGAALVVFMTDNFIITKVLGPEEVPAYNISYRYFNLLAVFFGLITTPFWSAFTEAFVKKDTPWIRKSMRRLILV
jgi:O-antigen/teichoic acid export membrane protein